LDVGGQLFYTHKSTLTAGSAYFAARFGGTFNAGSSYADERGKKVYFVDANGDLFVHILDYLRRGVASWPDDPKFHKRLAAEAEYFGVEAMLYELRDLASIAPNGSGKGILYWLGTNKGEEDYMNPYSRDKIRIELISKPGKPMKEVQKMNSHVSAFFEHHPSCSPNFQNNGCAMLWCDLQCGDSRHFNFVDVAVRPTHYSLRYGCCYGMSDWNFEASVDGISWDILHEVRKDRHLLQPSDFEIEHLAAEAENGDFVSVAEEYCRHTWKVDASSYYKYFRFASLTTEQLRVLYGTDEDGSDNLGPDGRVLFSRCLHGVGFELYGDVKSAT
jgi:hypothetical protein